jgi:hypothetical protein
MVPLATLNSAAVNIFIQVFARAYVFISLGYIPGSGITASNGNSGFEVLKNCSTASRSVCCILNVYQGCVSVPIFVIFCFLCDFFPLHCSILVSSSGISL